MRAIWQLHRRDLRRASQSTMALIIMFGLVIIPSLFTWFNVLASWDPFGNTRNLKVAVANSDEGYESDLVPIEINIGEQVVSALRANDDLAWVVTSEEDAIEGTRSGAYYAAIVLPADFSENMMTFYTPGAQPTHIDYYTNEKKSALAPKITGQGADEVSNQVNEMFAKTLSDVALNLVASLSDFLTDADTQAALTKLEGRVSQVSTQLRSGADTADMFSALLASSGSLAASAQELTAATGASLEDAGSALGSGVNAVGDITATLEHASASLSNALASSAAGYERVADRLSEVFSAVDSNARSQAEVLTSVAKRVDQNIASLTNIKRSLEDNIAPQLPSDAQAALAEVVSRIDAAIARQEAVSDALTAAAQEIASSRTDAKATKAELETLISEAKEAIARAENSYRTSLQPQLADLASSLSAATSTLRSLASDLGSAGGSTNTVAQSFTRAAETLTETGEAFREAAEQLDAVAQGIAQARDTGDFGLLREAIGSDPSMLAASLADPVGLEREAVFPVASFGSAMTPMYMVLALWVGALLMSVAIRVDVPAGTLPGVNLKPHQEYLGRYGMFGLLGLLQGLLVSLGALLFIDIQAVHPLLLILAACVTSLVFTSIIYAAVVAFGNAGKALCVLLLVFQISSSGGAYPLQLLPPWFQGISPFLPATHAIAAIRAAIAGVYNADYWVSLGTLCLFLIPALFLGLVLRKLLANYNAKLTHALESTKLM